MYVCIVQALNTVNRQLNNEIVSLALYHTKIAALNYLEHQLLVQGEISRKKYNRYRTTGWPDEWSLFFDELMTCSTACTENNLFTMQELAPLVSFDEASYLQDTVSIPLIVEAVADPVNRPRNGKKRSRK